MVGQGAARDAQPSIFTTYAIEGDPLNERVHYTSLDKVKAVAYDNVRGEWNIQAAEKRLCILEM